ncbi:DUF7344 domain-containing protein [Halomarina rubra]|uniref:DUF7344 domain-containing protein n=1 Tax=Halomarina rubra TaxID=2071873 RepID=A0ABD6ATH0_9EURY|nr:hypothetical protein [Halomarina rubra]
MVPETPPSADEAFALLANPDRRAVLRALRDHGSLDELALARHVAAARETDGGADPTETDGEDTVDTERVRAVHLSLWHVHLPRLDETALLDHDRGDRIVAPGPALAAVEPLLAYADAYPGDAHSPEDARSPDGGTDG